MPRFRSERDSRFGRELDLEAMIDHFGLLSVLEAISIVCGDKAEHIRTNWQGGPPADQRFHDQLAKAWERAGVAVDKVTGDKNVEAVS